VSIQRNGHGAGDVTGGELLGGPDVDHRRASRLDAIKQFLAADRVGVVAQVGLAGGADVRQPVVGDGAQQGEQRGHVVTGEPVEDLRAFAAGGDEVGLLEGLQVCGGGGQPQFRRLRECIDRALALGEQVEQLQPLAAGQCLAHASELVEQGVLGIPVAAHSSPIIFGIV
jgi:hypothetical protein